MPAGLGSLITWSISKEAKANHHPQGFGQKRYLHVSLSASSPLSGLVDFKKVFVWYLKVLSFEPSRTVQDALSLKSPNWKKRESEQKKRTFIIPSWVTLSHPRCCFPQQNPSANILGDQGAGRCGRQFRLPGSTHCI